MPVVSTAPPVEAAYHLTLPALAVAANETVPASQTLPGVVPVMLGVLVTVANTEVLDEVVHPLVVAST